LEKRATPEAVADNEVKVEQTAASCVGLGVGVTNGVCSGLAYATAVQPDAGSNGSGILAENVTKACGPNENTVAGTSRMNPDCWNNCAESALGPSYTVTTSPISVQKNVNWISTR